LIQVCLLNVCLISTRLSCFADICSYSYMIFAGYYGHVDTGGKEGKMLIEDEIIINK
jgi:hypothetical protein